MSGSSILVTLNALRVRPVAGNEAKSDRTGEPT
jgi:hypothetical protein